MADQVKQQMERRLGKAWMVIVGILVGLAAVGGTVMAATQGSVDGAPEAAPSAAPVAHEEATVGPYELTIGFGEEPAVAGEINHLIVEIVDQASGEQVEGIDRITYTVTYGGVSQTFSAGVSFGETSAFDPPILPTMPGDYSVDITFTDADGESYTATNIPRSVHARAEYAVPASR